MVLDIMELPFYVFKKRFEIKCTSKMHEKLKKKFSNDNLNCRSFMLFKLKKKQKLNKISIKITVYSLVSMNLLFIKNELGLTVATNVKKE